MPSYETLATCYDKLTADVDYEQWADYIHKRFQNIPGKIVLDLACGTGSLSFALAKKGYEMIGVDLSTDMLGEAMEKNIDFQGEKPIFLCQSMDKLDLFGTIDGCVCCLDSVNYVTEPEKLQETFQRVSLFLMPKGIFLFDIKSPYAFMSQNGQFSLDENEDLFCIWRTETDPPFSRHEIDLFQRQGDLWAREVESHCQRIYPPEEILEYLKNSGFTNIRQYANLSENPPSEEEERIFFVAEKI
ncbi:MAG: methyltransferase domain-containing protein [Eubacteriales bacterium]